MNFSSKYVFKRKERRHPLIESYLSTRSATKCSTSKPPTECSSTSFKRPKSSTSQVQTHDTHRLKRVYDDDDEPDTNVVTIKFDGLKEVPKMQAGDPIKCINCEAYLSSLSKVEEKQIEEAGGYKLWKCEFCSCENDVQIEKEEIPNTDDVTYMLQPPIHAQSATTSQDINSEYVIYCIDISGSMSECSNVKVKCDLLQNHIRLQTIEQMIGEPNRKEARTERFMSRLEAVQAALSANLTKLVKKTPNKRVGLVTFNQEVHFYGDGLIDEVTISGDDLNKKESIVEKANISGDFKPVQDTSAILNNKIINLEEGGETALGPALYYSILIASRKPGSKVILCTDGLANKGIGSFNTDEDQSIYYNELASLASEKGVSVSIITIKGTNSKLAILAEVADKTGGFVNTVDSLDLEKEFKSILKDQIIATNVVAKFLLHKALFVRDFESLNNKESCVTKSIGNVTIDTEVTFEFSIKEKIDESLKEVPFQLQIVYKAKDGSKALRILTQNKPLTDDKNLAEAEADGTVLAQHFITSNARLMQKPELVDLSIDRQNKWKPYMSKRSSGTNNFHSFPKMAYNQAIREMSEVAECMMNVKKNKISDPSFYEVSDEVAARRFRLANFKAKFQKE